MRKIGFHFPKTNFLQINLEDLDKNNTVVAFLNIGNPTNIEFRNIVETNVGGLDTIPKQTIDYFNKCLNKGIKPLLFAGTAHILYKGNLNIEQYPIIRI